MTDQLRIYFDVLIAVAWADGKVTVEERKRIESACRAAGLDAKACERIRAALRREPGTPSEAAASAKRASNDTIAEVARDAYLVALADNQIAPAEIAVIDAFLAGAGVPAGKRPAIHEWARRSAAMHVDGVHLLMDARQRSRSH